MIQISFLHTIRILIYVSLSGELVDFTTNVISTNDESIYPDQSMPLNRSATNATKMETSTSLWIIVVTVICILLILLLIARNYFHGSKWASISAKFDINPIKYISDKQLIKIQIDMNADDVLNYENGNVDDSHQIRSEFESKIDGNDNENVQNNNEGNIFKRVEQRLCRSKILAAGEYSNLNETN